MKIEPIESEALLLLYVDYLCQAAVASGSGIV